MLFEPRLAWLKRMHRQGNVSNSSLSSVERAWQGIRLHEKENTEDGVREKEICDAIGECEFVCSVKIGPTGAEAGLQKALTAARLATTAISLAWDRPSSVLHSMALTFDRQPYLQRNLVLFPNGNFGWRSSWSYLPGGVTWMQRENWDGLAADLDKIFNCAGEVISHATNSQGDVSRPMVLNVLFQAMLWFHEGCREQIDTMAIVKFCSAMEALSGGRGTKGIRNLLKSRLALKDEDKVRKNIEKIYGDGRSRIVHGTSDKLGHDWSESRDFSEILARLCLIKCLEWASTCPEMNSPEGLLQPKI